MAQNPSRDPNPGWPAAAIVALRRHWLEGLTTAEIACRLGKTARAVECKIYKLRSRGWDLPARRCKISDHAGDGGGMAIAHGADRGSQRALRRCLYFGENSDSSHPCNRICARFFEAGPFPSAMV